MGRLRRWKCITRIGLSVPVCAMAIMVTSCGGSGLLSASDHVAQTVYFRPVYCELAYVSSIGLQPPRAPLSANSCNSEVVSQYASTPRRLATQTATVIEPAINHDARFVLGPADLTSSDLLGAWVEPEGSAFGAILGFTTGGTVRLAEMMAARYSSFQVAPSGFGADEAIDVNGEVASFARITSPIAGGCIIIAGSRGQGLSGTDASNLVAELRGAAHLVSQPHQPECSGNKPTFVLDGKKSGGGSLTGNGETMRLASLAGRRHIRLGEGKWS